MSTGLQIFNAQGTLLLDSQSVTWNFVSAVVAPANTAASASIDTHGVLTEFQVFRSFVNAIPDNQEAVAHSVSISGTEISATGGTVDTLVVVLGR